jgi:hypothetical protein
MSKREWHFDSDLCPYQYHSFPSATRRSVILYDSLPDGKRKGASNTRTIGVLIKDGHGDKLNPVYAGG